VRRWFWFLLVVFFVGVVLLALGLYCFYVVGDSRLGFWLAIAGAVALGVLLSVGMLYVARVRLKILREGREF
jgi:hypothetical protein